MSIQDKIKPCHRCGETAHYDEDWAVILCGVCGYYLQQDSMDLEQLIKFWNTRKIEENLESQLEEAREIQNKLGEWVSHYAHCMRTVDYCGSLEDALEMEQYLYELKEQGE